MHLQYFDFLEDTQIYKKCTFKIVEIVPDSAAKFYGLCKG